MRPIPAPSSSLVGRDGRTHAYAVDLNRDAARTKLAAARARLVSAAVASLIEAAATAHAEEAVAARREAIAQLPARGLHHHSPSASPQRHNNSPAPTSGEDTTAGGDAGPLPADAVEPSIGGPKPSCAPAVVRSYRQHLSTLRAKYPAAAAAPAPGREEPGAGRRSKSTALTGPPKPSQHRHQPPSTSTTAPKAGAGSRRLPPLATTPAPIRGGAWDKAPRRTLFDDARSPLKSSAMAPSPGPAMLRYLELFDAIAAPEAGVGGRHGGGGGGGAGSSQWHREPPRERTRRAEVGCRPLYLPPMDDHVRGGAIGTSPR